MSIAAFSRQNGLHPSDVHAQMDRVKRHRAQLNKVPYTEDQLAIAAVSDLVNRRVK